MFWKLAIQKNRRALAQIVAGWFLLVNWQKGEAPPQILGPITSRRLATALRKIEAALRRLIVLYAKTQNVKLCAETRPQTPLPDFASFNHKAAGRVAPFNLFDPRKPLLLVSASPSGSQPFMNALSLGGGQESIHAEDKQSSQKLLSRLAAIDLALSTLPRQAKRLVRVMEKRKLAPPGRKKAGPMRPGFPPGYQEHPKHDEDHILRECHGLVRDWEMEEP